VDRHLTSARQASADQRFRVIALTTAALLACAGARAAEAPGAITVRTENFPRPPYSGATYYIYERGGRVVCTKLEVCNKFENCSRKYVAGPFKEPEDVETGAPYGSTPAVEVPPASLAKHVCLTKFGLTRR
jgi:hypothetical protein